LNEKYFLLINFFNNKQTGEKNFKNIFQKTIMTFIEFYMHESGIPRIGPLDIAVEIGKTLRDIIK